MSESLAQDLGLAEREVCECGQWADECDRDHEAEEAGGHTQVIYDDGERIDLCQICHSTGCEH